MKEQYKPSREEIKKAEKMMTDEQKNMSEERKQTYEVGREHGHKEASEMIKNATRRGISELENKRHIDQRNDQLLDVIIKCGLSKKAEDALFQHDIEYNPNNGLLYPTKVISEELMIELITKLPHISSLDVSDNKMINLNIVKKFWKRFPNANIFAYGDFNGQDLMKELDEELGGTVINNTKKDYILSCEKKGEECGYTTFIGFDSTPNDILNFLQHNFNCIK